MCLPRFAFRWPSRFRSCITPARSWESWWPSRDIVAALAFLGVWIGRRPAALPARAGGKAVTVCQLLTLVAFIADSPFVRPLAWATAAIGLYAIWDYGRAATRGGRSVTPEAAGAREEGERS